MLLYYVVALNHDDNVCVSKLSTLLIAHECRRYNGFSAMIGLDFHRKIIVCRLCKLKTQQIDDLGFLQLWEHFWEMKEILFERSFIISRLKSIMKPLTFTYETK